MTTTTALTITTIETEARVLDTDLAVALGFLRPRAIRDLIVRNVEELSRYGICRSVRQNTGQRGRPQMAYYLNEMQALMVCMFSRTEKAADVREEVIRVFTAYRRGTLAPTVQAPTSMKEALLLALAQCERIEQLQIEKTVLEVKQRVMEPVAAVGRRSRAVRRKCPILRARKHGGLNAGSLGWQYANYFSGLTAKDGVAATS